MKRVLRGERESDEQEPTPRAGPCIEDLKFIDSTSAHEAWLILQFKEYIYIDLLIYEEEDLEIYLRSTVNDECLKARELHIKGCSSKADMLAKLIDEPEVTKVYFEKIKEKSCLVIISSFDPVMRAERLLEKIGITGNLRVLAYRPVGELG